MEKFLALESGPSCATDSVAVSESLGQASALFPFSVCTWTTGKPPALPASGARGQVKVVRNSKALGQRETLFFSPVLSGPPNGRAVPWALPLCSMMSLSETIPREGNC